MNYVWEILNGIKHTNIAYVSCLSVETVLTFSDISFFALRKVYYPSAFAVCLLYTANATEASHSISIIPNLIVENDMLLFLFVLIGLLMVAY